MTSLEYGRERLRRCVARDIGGITGQQDEVLHVLQELGIFGDWTEDELYSRPVNVSELEEIVWERIYS